MEIILVVASNVVVETSKRWSAAFARKRRREHSEEDLSRRAARAVRQVELGELSASRQALEGESVASGTLRTLRALTDPERRPEVPREPLLPELSHHVPRARVVLDSELCTTNLGGVQQPGHQE